MKLSESQKWVLRGLVNFTCENCNKKEEQVGILQAHRIIRGNKGGKYVPHNILMLCDECHKVRHSNEF